MLTLKELQEDLNAISSQEEKIDYLIELGQDLPSFNQEKKALENKVPGCVSGVYLYVTKEHNQIHIHVMSESLIVKGILVIFLAFFNNSTKEEILQNKDLFEQFIQEHNLASSVLATRANATGQILQFLEQKIE